MGDENSFNGYWNREREYINRDISDLKAQNDRDEIWKERMSERVGKLETRVTVYATILGAVGAAIVEVIKEFLKAVGK